MFRLVKAHLDEFLRVYAERFARTHGPLRPVVERVLRKFLTCGLVEHGFARAYCESCRESFVVAFSCRGRSFCPSCEKKKQLLWSEWLRTELLAPVAHRHVVLTIPRLLRPLFRRRRELLLELVQAGAQAVEELCHFHLGPTHRPGIVLSLATASDLLQWNPHLHLLVTDGAFDHEGVFSPVNSWDSGRLLNSFRERLLARLVHKNAISRELVQKLLQWRRPGFSAFVGGPILPEDTQALEDVASYVVRNPLSLKKLVYIDGQKAVLYHSKMNPGLGRNFEAMDPLEWLARLSDHIPDPRKHRTFFYGYYASRTRAARSQHRKPRAKSRSTSSTWARLIHKVFSADPLRCPNCGAVMRLVAFLTEPRSIRRFLQNTGLSPPEEDPSSSILERRYVPVDDEGRELQT